MADSSTYSSPLCTRYASKSMSYIFSEDKKFTTWRALWVALAEAEHELGLNVTDEQISELKQYQNILNLDVAKAREAQCRHDVMSHVYAYGVQCPTAKGIIHLGATSCYVGDNTDIIQMHDALEIIIAKVIKTIKILSDFALKYSHLPTLAFTHFQPAQPTTVGKRATLWIEELLLDLEQLTFQYDSLKLLGSKGTTGTQASFLELFNGDHAAVKQLDQLIVQKLGFSDVYPVSGQTYSRKIDSFVLQALSGVAQSAAKFSNDLRLLQHLKEIEEPFESHQIGSSAMAYKRNPMRSERIASLARYVITSAVNPALTASSQWFERTLDDSANRRICIPECFLALDGILNLYINVADGLVVYEQVIAAHLAAELPFMASENIMMQAVKNGGDRQELHEAIRQHSIEASRSVKQFGLPNNLLELIAADDSFALTSSELSSALEPSQYIGRSSEQTQEFIHDIVQPTLEKLKHFTAERSEITV